MKDTYGIKINYKQLFINDIKAFAKGVAKSDK